MLTEAKLRGRGGPSKFSTVSPEKKQCVKKENNNNNNYMIAIIFFLMFSIVKN